MYLSNQIRYDIAYAIFRLNRYTNNSNIVHWTVLDRVFKYVKGTIDYFLYFMGYSDILEEYSDSNWIFDIAVIKSNSSYIFFLAIVLFLAIF